MASRLKVDELRAQLSQRGLETSGTKPVLVERLESALEKEEKEKLSTDDTTKKRPRESEDDESDVPEKKKKVVQAVQEMGIRELREQAKLRGISAGGSKKDIIERLSADLEENLEAIPEVKEEEDESVKEKLHEEEIEKLREMSIAQLREQAKIRGVSAGGSKKEIIERLSSDLEENPEEIPEVKEEEDESVKDKLHEQEIERLREMSIAQLREQAKIRGVSAGGSKKEIIERLCADLQEVPEEVPKVKEEVDGGVKEKSREEEIARLHEMGVRQLREEATLRGISTSGSKKELLERLCSDLQEDKKEIPKDKEVSEKLKEKIVTATKKGGAVLDQYLPDHIKTQYHVLRDGDEFYDAMLNQTNVGDNNNKFYMIQALESDGGGTFMVYNRWGRVGVKGQDKLHGPYTSRDSAIQEFELKFSAKTKNQWSDRKDFVYHPKCYTWLEMDYSEAGEESKVPEKLNDTTMVAQPRETQLEPRIAEFISLICNVSMMKQQMLEIGYNAEKLPLGKLSKSTILKGYGVLKRIADVIDQSDKRALIEQLSGEFYTVIPHDFGFKKMWEFIIDTPVKLKLKLEMVEALGEIELATKLLKDDNEIPGDPFFSHYKRLGCELAPVDVDSREYSMVMRYMQNTHAKTHSGYTVDIIQLFRVSRPGETERFTKFANTKNRALLWHGSRLTNWTGILSQGLRIAPPEAPSTGYMFGKGVYFADMFSKSANYCYSSSASRAGVLLLCEVALGEMAELLNANYDADKLPAGKLSTKGVGITAPDPSEYEALDDGVVVPLGKPKEQMSSRGSLLYNEYIVYNVDQIRMRYLVQVNFNYKRY